MFTYCVTFRIADKTISGKTYDDRRDALMDNVRSKDQGFWEETTSFILVESELTTDAFAAKAAKGLSAKDDLVIVFDPTDMSLAYFGPVEHPEVLKSFFKVSKKLP